MDSLSSTTVFIPSSEMIDKQDGGYDEQPSVSSDKPKKVSLGEKNQKKYGLKRPI